jgi:hypothetical protein
VLVPPFGEVKQQGAQQRHESSQDLSNDGRSVHGKKKNGKPGIEIALQFETHLPEVERMMNDATRTRTPVKTCAETSQSKTSLLRQRMVVQYGADRRSFSSTSSGLCLTIKATASGDQDRLSKEARGACTDQMLKARCGLVVAELCRMVGAERTGSAAARDEPSVVSSTSCGPAGALAKCKCAFSSLPGAMPLGATCWLLKWNRGTAVADSRPVAEQLW